VDELMTEGDEVVHKLDLRGADIVLRAGRTVDGLRVGDLARIGDHLADVSLHSSICSRCDGPLASQYVRQFFLEPLCREHANEGHRLTWDEMVAERKRLQANGAPPHVLDAYFNSP